MSTVLIDDDDPGIRFMLTDLLEEAGYHVADAAHGQEAITYLHTSGIRPCMILLDLMMPIMNGRQFRTIQQQDPTFATIPVVVLSAVDDIKQAAGSIGAEALIAKPVDFDALLETVATYCA